MKTFLGALALLLALPVSTDVALARGGGGGHGGGGGGFHGGGGGGHGGGGWHGGGWHGGGWHGHGGWYGGYGGVYIGGWPYWDDGYYPGYYTDGDDYYDYPPDYAAPSGPVPGQTSNWYYCHNPAGYYPYVQSCAGGWQAVAPTPPDAAPAQH